MKKFLIIFFLFCPQIWGQTLHVDARDTDNIFTTAGDPPSGTPADNGDVQQWDDESLTQWFNNATPPNWRQSSPGLLLPNLDFDGSTDFLQLRTTGGVDRTLEDIHNAGAKSLLIAIRLDENCDGTDGAAPYNNDTIINDSGGFWGIHCWIDTGQNKLQLYNWDGSADAVTLNVSINTNYVVGFRHDGTNLHGSLNCGSETTALSGNTSTLTGGISIGSYAGIRFASVRIGIIKAWDTSDAGGNFATECATIKNDFVEASVSARKSLSMLGVGK